MSISIEKAIDVLIEAARAYYLIGNEQQAALLFDDALKLVDFEGETSPNITQCSHGRKCINVAKLLLTIENCPEERMEVLFMFCYVALSGLKCWKELIEEAKKLLKRPSISRYLRGTI